MTSSVRYTSTTIHIHPTVVALLNARREVRRYWLSAHVILKVDWSTSVVVVARVKGHPDTVRVEDTADSPLDTTRLWASRRAPKSLRCSVVDRPGLAEELAAPRVSGARLAWKLVWDTCRDSFVVYNTWFCCYWWRERKSKQENSIQFHTTHMLRFFL